MRTALALTAVLALGGLAAAPVVASPAVVTAGTGFVEVTFDHAVTTPSRRPEGRP